MLSTQAEIEQSIRGNLPIIFGQIDSLDPESYQQKYNALVDYASAVSAPFLGPETVRYQSMLLYISLIFLSLRMLRIPQVKIGDSTVLVDSRLLVIYAIFIGALIVVFLAKAYVDYQRAIFLRTRNDQAIVDLRLLQSIGLVRIHIQNYFWLEIFDAIGRTYKAYDDAVAAALNKLPDFKHISMQAMSLDRQALGKVSETQAEIVKQDAFLSSLIADLTTDENRFREEADAALRQARSESKDIVEETLGKGQAYDGVSNAFDRTLHKWFDARNHLGDERLRLEIEKVGESPDLHRLQAMLRVLKGVVTIRRIYATLEVMAPVAFAIFTIVYVRLR